MRFFLLLLLTAVATYFAALLLPWWAPMFMGLLLACLIPLRKNFSSFWATALGTAMSWLLIIVMTDVANEHILSKKMAALFNLPSYTLMILVSILVGFITGGLGGLMGNTLRKLLSPKTSTSSLPQS